MRVVHVPDSLDARTFDDLAREVEEAGDEKTLFDARHLRWVDPVGLTGLLAAGRVVAERRGEPARIELPESGEVSSYLARMGFPERARSVFQMETPRRCPIPT